jgi:lipopolysaccharide export system permease protein
LKTLATGRVRAIKTSPLNLLDRYILREWLKILALAMGATLGLITMQTLYDDLQDLIEHGATFADMVMFVVIKMPSFLALVIPIVLLVSLLYSLGQMHRNNEIMAMRAAGMSLFRISRSIWIAGIFLCGLTWWLNASVVPWSVEATRAMSDQLEFEYQSTHVEKNVLGLTRTIAFDNQRQGRIWMINRYNRYTQRAFGVSVSEMDTKRREKTRLVAREAKFDPERNCWVFWNGRETWIDPETGDVTRSAPFDEKIKPHFTEEPKLMLIFDIKPSNLSFFELQRIIDHFRIEENPKVTMYAVRYYTLLADTLSPLIILAIAIPFAVTGVRVNPAVGVSKSIGLFVIYFLVLKFATVLGTRGVLDPLVAAWVPNGVMGLLGAWVFYQRR